MNAILAALVSFAQALIAPIASLWASLATYNAGKTAADDAARKATDDAQAKADAVREANHSAAVRDPGGLRNDDGFKRPD